MTIKTLCLLHGVFFYLAAAEKNKLQKNCFRFILCHGLLFIISGEKNEYSKTFTVCEKF